MVGDPFRRNATDGTDPLRERGVDGGVGPDSGIAADADRAEQLGTGADIHVISQYRRTGPVLAGSAADVDADVDAAVFPHSGGATDDDRSDMDQGQSLAEHIDGDGPLIPVAQSAVAESQQLANRPPQRVLAAVCVVFRFPKAFIELEPPVSDAHGKWCAFQIAGQQVRLINPLPILSRH